MSLALRAAALAIAVAAIGCDGDDTSDAAPADATAPDAPAAIADAGGGEASDGAVLCSPGLLAQAPFCDGAACVGRDDTLVPSSMVCDRIAPAGAAVGTCDGRTVVFLEERHGFDILWFDATGRLVAVAGGDDIGSGIARCASRDGTFPVPPLCAGAPADYDLGCRCPPAPPPPSPPPSVVVTPAVLRGSCTDPQIDALVDCALGLADGSAGCDPLGDAGAPADRACAACLFGDGTNGAIFLRGAGTFNARPNVAGCIANVEADAGAASCAHAYAVAADCAASACATQCYSASAPAEQGCWQRAIDGACGASSACFAADAGPLEDACMLNASIVDQARAVARAFCAAP